MQTQLKNLITLTLLSLIFSASCFAKNLSLFKKFAIESPLSYQSVRTIEQDGDGFIWLGSHEGLHRFDGYQLKSFHHDSTEPTSISADTISELLVDRDGELWVGTRGGGLNLYQQDNHSFVHFRTSNDLLNNDNINELIEDSLGNIWVATEKGLNIVSKTQQGFVTTEANIAHTAASSIKSVDTIVETQNKEVWAVINSGQIQAFDLKGTYLRTLDFSSITDNQLSTDKITALYADDQGFVWIGTSDGKLFRYNPINKDYRNFTQDTFALNDNHMIKSLFQDSEGAIWIATDKGLLLFDIQSNQFQLYQHKAENPYSLSSDIVLTVFEDNEGIMWLGTFSGVNRWDPTVATFNQYNTRTSLGLNNDVITNFAESSEGVVYVGTYGGGISTFNKETGELAEAEFNHVFARLRVMTLFVDKDHLWIGTRASGLFSVNLSTNEVESFTHVEHEPDSISADSITDIHKDKKGNIWVSSYEGGLNKYLGQGKFKHYLSQGDNSSLSPSSDHILQIVESRAGDLWLATYGGGINKFTPDTETFTYFLHDEADNQSISSNLSWTLFIDSKDNLWIGSQSAGLNYLTKTQQLSASPKFVRLNIRDGLKSRTVYAITEDDQGFIWFSSNKGVSRYSQNTGSFKHFDTAHGLTDLEHNHTAILHGQNNTLYFGTAKGFTNINPEQVISTRSAPQVRLTNILLLNESMAFETPLSQLTRLEFDYTDQLISFEYTGLNYAAPESTRYKYRLLGFDKEWVDANKLRRATYTNLPAGQYQLQIIAGNNDNLWSDPGLTLDIVVHPAPWNTWWAYLSYTALISLILLSYARFLSRKLVKEQQQSEQLKIQVSEQTKDFQIKNVELEKANILLERAATVDKLTQVKSRRYLDIYIQQASDLMAQIHQSITPVNNYSLPRLFLLMVRFNNINSPTNSQLLNLSELLMHCRDNNDHVIRWSENTFAVIGYEKEDNARLLTNKLIKRAHSVFPENDINVAFSFYPFNIEEPMQLSWDQASVIAEHTLQVISRDAKVRWIGVYQPLEQPFDFNRYMQTESIADMDELVKTKQS